MTGCFAYAKTPATITGQAQGNNEMVNTCAGCLRNRPEFASPLDSLSALPVLAPLVLRGAAQTPASPLSSAHRRHGPHTGHVRHICLASSIWSREAPEVPRGKNRSGSTLRQ